MSAYGVLVTVSAACLLWPMASGLLVLPLTIWSRSAKGDHPDAKFGMSNFGCLLTAVGLCGALLAFAFRAPLESWVLR